MARSRSSAGYRVALIMTPSSQRVESPRYPGRFSLETREGRAPASTDLAAAGRTAKVLDPVGTPVVASGDQGVHLRIGDTVVRAPGVPAGIALGGNTAGSTPSTPTL